MLQLCPKCQFRLAPGRHICSTCGHLLSAKKESVKADIVATPKVVNNTKAPKGFWHSLFVPSEDKSANDKEALGET